VPKVSSAITFIACMAGSEIDRARVVQTIKGAMHPHDQAIVVDGSYGPTPFNDIDVPAELTVLRLADAPLLSLAYDRIAAMTTNEHLIFIGTGCSIARADIDRIRAKLTTVGLAPGAVVLSPFQTGSDIALDARSVIGVSRRAWAAIGGMAVIEDRARRVGAGFVGSGDLFEVFLHEVRRSGWPIEQVRQHARSGGVPKVPAMEHGGEDVDPTLPPSRRVPFEIRAAMGPGAAATVGWFSDFLPETQVESLTALVGSDYGGQGGEGGWSALAVARMLWWRGQRPYAAHILERVDLRSYLEPTDISDIVLILSTAGCPVATLVNKLAHAPRQLAAVIAAQPVDQASSNFVEWWKLDPGSEAVCLGVLTLAPTLSLVDAAAWHDRMLLIPRATSPLLAVARDARRPSVDRAVAARFLEFTDAAFCDADLAALVAAHDPEVRESIDRAAQDLLTQTSAASVR
jgi:hypothetical protein